MGIKSNFERKSDLMEHFGYFSWIQRPKIYRIQLQNWRKFCGRLPVLSAVGHREQCLIKNEEQSQEASSSSPLEKDNVVQACVSEIREYMYESRCIGRIRSL